MDLNIPIKGAFVHSDKDQDEQNRLHVVLAQVYPNSSEQFLVTDALPKLEALTQKAANEGADVIVFPEYFLTGATHEAWHHAKHSDAIPGHNIAPWIDDIDQLSLGLMHTMLRYLLFMRRPVLIVVASDGCPLSLCLNRRYRTL